MSAGTAGSGLADERALAAFRAELLRFVRRRVRDDAVAEDLVQDVLLKMLARRDELVNRGKLRPWLFQITRNAIVDHFRSQRPTELLPDDLAAAENDDRRAEQELAGCMQPLLDTLPAAYAQAVRLVELGGQSQREAAAALSLSVSGAKTRVQRGRRMLVAALLRCCEIERHRDGSVAAYECRQPQEQCGCPPREGDG